MGKGKYSLRSDSESCYSFIKARLQEWIATEIDSYRLLGVSAIFPTRLVSLEGTNLKLVESENKYLRYVALSHCWGNGVNF
jgi:hypothetical protein